MDIMFSDHSILFVIIFKLIHMHGVYQTRPYTFVCASLNCVRIFQMIVFLAVVLCNLLEQGFCLLGNLCLYDHGVDPVIIEDVNLPLPPAGLIAFPGRWIWWCRAFYVLNWRRIWDEVFLLYLWTWKMPKVKSIEHTLTVKWCMVLVKSSCFNHTLRHCVTHGSLLPGSSRCSCLCAESVWLLWFKSVSGWRLNLRNSYYSHQCQVNANQSCVLL